MKLNKGVVTIIVIILLVFLILNFSHATTDNEIVNSGELNSESQNPKVEAIQITSPSTGTYSEEQNVYIRVYFDDKITGISPTLKIKFGEGKERNITNGIIHNDAVVGTFGQYIECSYNIQEGDNGYLTTTGIKGGDIKDIDGNKAILTCPEITGSISINAKTKVESEEEKIDKEETKATKKSKKDKTIATGERIPYTVLKSRIIVMILVINIIGIIAKIKYNSYKDI